MATSLGTKTQDPEDKLDYTINWSGLLRGDTIQTSVWTVPGAITKTNESNSDSQTGVFLSGGVAGTSYVIENKITTVGGRIIERSFTLAIQEL